MLLGLSSAMLLTACSGSGVSDIKPLTLEEVAGNRLAQMSQDEKDGMVYQVVSDSILVDSSKLVKVESNDLTRMNGLLNGVNRVVMGDKSAVKEDGSLFIKEDYANYLLMEFARTPYQWKQVDVVPVGFDPASRLYFADVTYKTTNKYKEVIPSSKIATGSPDEETMKQSRYTDYLYYLTGLQNGAEDSAETLSTFTSRWGPLEAIFEEQQGTSLLERVQARNTDGLGSLTYSGLIQDSTMNVGAEMTFRYVFKYKYNLGEETDLEIDSLYLKGYKTDNKSKYLDEDNKIIQPSESVQSVEVLKPFVDKLVLSYHKSVEESNNIGLYQLFSDYAGVDKYYEDINRYTYNSIDGYNFSIVDRKGTDLKVVVNRINKVRAKGAEMSLPTYDETLLYNLVLSNDDKIKIKSVHLLDSRLVGEPLSVIKNVSGVSEIIQYSGDSFTDDNRLKIEDTLRKFANVVYTAKVDTKEFGEVVDVGVSQATLQKMTDLITAVPDTDRKVNYVVSWDTKTNVFASVTIREIFEKADQNLDTESVVDLVNRDGEWSVVNYTRKLSIKTGATTLDTKNALSEDSSKGIKVLGGSKVSESKKDSKKVEETPTEEVEETVDEEPVSE